MKNKSSLIKSLDVSFITSTKSCEVLDVRCKVKMNSKSTYNINTWTSLDTFHKM